MMVRKAIPSLQLGPKSFTFNLLSLGNYKNSINNNCIHLL